MRGRRLDRVALKSEVCLHFEPVIAGVEIRVQFLAESPTYITAHTGFYHHGMIDQVSEKRSPTVEVREKGKNLRPEHALDIGPGIRTDERPFLVASFLDWLNRSIDYGVTRRLHEPGDARPGVSR